jgi:hypothetical protein
LPKDPRGVPDGEAYVPLLRAGVDHTEGVGSSPPHGVKCHNPELLSFIERSLAFSLHLNPRVLSVRTQYAQGDWEELVARIRAGERIRRTEVPSLDLLVTLWRPAPATTPGYHGFSVKRSSDLKKKGAFKTVIRDRRFCRAQGWGWSLYTERDVDKLVTDAGKNLYHWSLDASVDRRGAETFAQALLCQRGDANLATRLARCADRLGLPDKAAYAYFAHAVLHGCIQLDPKAQLAPRSPLRVLRSKR